MNFFTSQVLMPIITNLVAAAMVYGIGKWLSHKNISAETVKGVANNAAKKTVLIAWELGQYTFLFWYFITQLRSLVEPDGPPSRVDALMISFWTAMMVLLFIRLLAGAPLFQRKD